MRGRRTRTVTEGDEELLVDVLMAASGVDRASISFLLMCTFTFLGRSGRGPGGEQRVTHIELATTAVGRIE